MSAFPLRVVWRLVPREEHDARVQILVSVPKRHLHRAVWRNRTKRQIREAYRTNKHIVSESIDSMPDKMLLIGFLWLKDSTCPSTVIRDRIVNLLSRIAENIERTDCETAKPTTEKP